MAPKPKTHRSKRKHDHFHEALILLCLRLAPRRPRLDRLQDIIDDDSRVSVRLSDLVLLFPGDDVANSVDVGERAAVGERNVEGWRDADVPVRGQC